MYCLQFLFLFLLFLHADALAFIFSALLLASLSSFFLSTCPCVRSECPCSPRWSRGSLLVPIAGFEAMFWVEWVGADATGRNKFYGGFCLRAPPSNHGHHLSTFKAYRPLYLPGVNLAPRWEGGTVGVRNERQTHLPHYKTNSRVIRRVIRFGLVLELSGLVVRTIWLIVRIISSP